MQHIAIVKEFLDGVEVNSINSRSLYKDLEIKTEYSHWIKRAIDKYDFTDGEDYLVKSDGVQKQDYIVTLDMAKELCMVTNTKKGREQRKYFISIEKQHNKKSIASLNDQLSKTQALFHTQEIMGEVVTEHDKRIKNLEKNVRMESWQERNLMDAKNKKVYELAEDDKKLANTLHRKVWGLFKKRFHLPRYSELKAGQYENGLEFIHSLTMSDMVS